MYKCTFLKVKKKVYYIIIKKHQNKAKMIKNTGVIQTLCKKSLLYHKKDLTFEKYVIIVFCKSNLSNMVNFLKEIFFLKKCGRPPSPSQLKEEARLKKEAEKYERNYLGNQTVEFVKIANKARNQKNNKQ